MKRCLLFSALGLLLWHRQAHAQQELTDTNVVQYDFAEFTGGGFGPEPSTGQLDSDEWIATGVLGMDLGFGDASSNQDFANGVSVGGEDEGGIWAFTGVPRQCGNGTQTMLGVQPSNMTFSPGSWQLRLTNMRAGSLTEIHLQYGFAWLNDSGRSMTHTVQVQRLDALGGVTATIDVPSLDVETPVDADANPTWDGQCQSATINLLDAAIDFGDQFVIVFRVDDGTGSGTRDELAIGEVQVSAMALADGGPILTPDAGLLDDNTAFY